MAAVAAVEEICEAPMQNAFYTLRPLTKRFGAEVLGCDLKSIDFSPVFIARVKEDLREHRVLLFRKQDLSGQRQVDFSAKLGRIESTFYKHPRSPHPDIFRVSNDESEGCTNVGRTGWHLDGTFMETPFMFQTMYFPSVAEGGETWFIPLKELYESQDSSTRERWDRMWMITGKREAPIHPLVYKHPFRGDPTMCFHCGEPFVSAFAIDNATAPTAERQLQRELLEPGPVQKELTTAIEVILDEYGIRMKWEAGDMTINDNLGLAHYATPGTQGNRDQVGLRILHRTTIMGGEETIPKKKDGRTTKSFK